jgi:hypothetical protein
MTNTTGCPSFADFARGMKPERRRNGLVLGDETCAGGIAARPLRTTHGAALSRGDA